MRGYPVSSMTAKMSSILVPVVRLLWVAIEDWKAAVVTTDDADRTTIDQWRRNQAEARFTDIVVTDKIYLKICLKTTGGQKLHDIL